jgi:hypothetical protein
MEISNKKVWLIMSKDRQYVAKGTPKNRSLVKTDNPKDKKRFLTYSSEGMARAGFSSGLGFYGPDGLELEAVECEMVIKEIKK